MRIVLDTNVLVKANIKVQDDDPVVYTAIQGKADVLCTLDRDFYEPEAVAFCRQRGVSVLGDVELLQKLKRL
jgi:predicted nucleic acid-binding protein